MNPVENTKPMLTNFQYTIDATGNLKITADINGSIRTPEIGFDERMIIIYVEELGNDFSSYKQSNEVLRSNVYRINNILHTYDESDISFDGFVNTNRIGEPVLEISIKSNKSFVDVLTDGVFVSPYVDFPPTKDGLYEIFDKPFDFPKNAYFSIKKNAFFTNENDDNRYLHKVEHKVYRSHGWYYIPVSHVK